MKIMTVSVAALALSCSLAFAQTASPPGGTTPPSGTLPPPGGTIAPPSGSFAPPGGSPSGSFGPPTAVPSPFTTAPNAPGTVGQGFAPGQSPPDLTRRYNPQDMTRPGRINPQDLSSGGGGGIAPGVPNIAGPESR